MLTGTDGASGDSGVSFPPHENTATAIAIIAYILFLFISFRFQVMP